MYFTKMRLCYGLIWAAIFAAIATTITAPHKASAFPFGIGDIFLPGSTLIGQGIGGVLGPATEPVANNFEGSGHRLIEDTDKRIAARIEDLDGVLAKNIRDVDKRVEQRIMQIDDVMKNRIEQTDKMLAKRLDQLDGIIDNKIQQIDKVAEKNIKTMDDKIKERIEQVDNVMARRIDQIDDVLGKNIEKADIAAEKRIGNLDIVATKASLTIESSISRIVLLACVVVFVSVAAWWSYSVGLQQWNAIPAGKFWGNLKKWAQKTWRPLLVQVGGVAACLMVIYGAYCLFSTGPQSEFEAMQTIHEEAYELSVKELNPRKAAYHADQLLILDASRKDYQAMVIKATVLQDVFSRPAHRTNAVMFRSIQERLDKIDALFLADRIVDLDSNVIRAFLIWQAGSSRAHEYEAAIYSADALARDKKATAKEKSRKKIRFTLHDMAVNYLENYLFIAPSNDDIRVATKLSYNDLPPSFREAKDEKLPTNEQLRAILTKELEGGAPLQHSPLSHLPAYNRLARSVHAVSMYQYPIMVEAYLSAGIVKPEDNVNSAGEIIRANNPKVLATSPQPAKPYLDQRRNQAAKSLIASWTEFDAKLTGEPLLRGTTAPITCLTLNDATFTRAQWHAHEKKLFEDNTSGRNTPIAPTLLTSFPEPIPEALLGKSTSAYKRAYLSPPRVFWARRYLDGMTPITRSMAVKECADVFLTNEKQLMAFETAFQAYLDLYLNSTDTTQLQKAAVNLMKISAEIGLLSPISSPSQGIYIPFAEYISEKTVKRVTQDTLTQEINKDNETFRNYYLSRKVRFL